MKILLLATAFACSSCAGYYDEALWAAVKSIGKEKPAYYERYENQRIQESDLRNE